MTTIIGRLSEVLLASLSIFYACFEGLAKLREFFWRELLEIGLVDRVEIDLAVQYRQPGISIHLQIEGPGAAPAGFPGPSGLSSVRLRELVLGNAEEPLIRQHVDVAGRRLHVWLDFPRCLVGQENDQCVDRQPAYS